MQRYEPGEVMEKKYDLLVGVRGRHMARNLKTAVKISKLKTGLMKNVLEDRTMFTMRNEMVRNEVLLSDERNIG